MQVAHLKIENFRNIRAAELYFDKHNLLVGINNVGKSTVCEALDLALGPDRIARSQPINEFDFYNSKYLNDDGTLVPITIEVTLTNLTGEALRLCAANIEHWHEIEQRLLTSGEIAAVDPAMTQPCVRVLFIGQYNADEDEFDANTYFSHSPAMPEGELSKISKTIKRSFGFLYLRALRTGSRALSLERGSLLDIILRMKQIRTGLWENSRKRLRDLSPPIDEGSQDLTPVLEAIESRLGEYVLVQGNDRATKLFVSQLTREHLRKTISFFLSLSPDQEPVPFQAVGTGTLNLLVLALLTFIAEIKEENVIFAMEEPEIALPPHTQRRITSYLLEQMNQCFVTSHSPYVIECFDPEQIKILSREDNGTLRAKAVTLSAGLKTKTYRKYIRRALAEAMLGRAVIIAEGITEQLVLTTVAQRMAETNPALFPFDLSGVTIINSDGDGSLWEFGAFFKSVGLATYAYFDRKNRTNDERQKITTNYDTICEIGYSGCEALIAAEISLDRQWAFVDSVRVAGRYASAGIPTVRPATDQEVRDLTIKLLRGGKGEGLAAELLETGSTTDLPATIVNFLYGIYQSFPRPQPRQPATGNSPPPPNDDEQSDSESAAA